MQKLETKSDTGVIYLLRFVLLHFRAIQLRMEWSQAIHKFTHGDKHIMLRSVNKVESAVNDLQKIIKDHDKEALRVMLMDLQESNIQYVAALIEQLWDLKEEELGEVTDLIDEHLRKKKAAKDVAAVTQ